MSLFCVLTVGCDENVERSPDRQPINAKLANSLNDIAMENAIISQHTLFPYHFGENAVELNELGQRDLAVLAKHFTEHPGCLNIRRNSISEDLYEARVSMVRDKLKEAGVNIDRINISDGMPGGSGMTSERVVTILEKEQQKAPRAKTTTGNITEIK
jgi:hypothetical protein